MSRITEDTAMRAIEAHIGAHTLAGFWAVVPYQHGLVTFKESPGGGAFVPEAFKVYATELCNYLQRQAAHDGKWVTCWSEFDLATGWPRMFHLLWLDRDGDTQFVVDIDERVASDIHDHADMLHYHAEPAWQQWREMMKDVDVKPHQTIAAGLGQRSADERAAPDMIASL